MLVMLMHSCLLSCIYLCIALHCVREVTKETLTMSKLLEDVKFLALVLQKESPSIA
jgi:hypothetical protein